MARTAHTKPIRVPPGSGPRPGKEPAGAIPLKARRHPLVASIAKQLQRCGVNVDLHGKAAKVVVGVSGGADSVALLLACAAIAKRRDRGEAFVEPIAVHVHHHLRSTADDDAKFGSELCERLDVELHVRHVEPARLKGNVSSNARRLRYEALTEVAIQRGAAFIAVAHHAEDQFETMLMALCRGAGLDGLSAMSATRDLGASVALIRPLLSVRKRECEELCKAAGVKWREDPSNRDVNRARARLRRDVMSVLEELWPDAAKRVSATAEAVQAARAALENLVEGAFGPATICAWPREHLRGLPLPVIAAGLRRAAVRMKPKTADRLDHDHLLDAAAAIADASRKPRRFDWPGGMTLEVRSWEVALHN